MAQGRAQGPGEDPGEGPQGPGPDARAKRALDSNLYMCIYIYIYIYIYIGQGDSRYFGKLGGTRTGILLSLAGVLEAIGLVQLYRFCGNIHL